MRALFHDVSSVKDYDIVRVPYRAEPVRHNDYCLVKKQAVEVLHYRTLIVSVQRVGRLVEKQELCVLVCCTRYQNPLLLPGAKTVTVYTDFRVVSEWQALDPFPDIGHFRRLPDPYMSGHSSDTPMFPAMVSEKMYPSCITEPQKRLQQLSL